MQILQEPVPLGVSLTIRFWAVRADALHSPVAISGPAVFLLTPFSWAAEPLAELADSDPRLFADLFRLNRLRIHIMALALAHMETELRPEIGRFLLRGLASEVVVRALGRGPPVGLSRALAHMPSYVLARESYRHLIELLDHQASAHLLFYPDNIDNSIIELLYGVPAPLRRPALLLAMRRGGGFAQLAGLADGLAVLVARGAAPSFDALVAELGLAWGPGQFASKLERVIERLPAVETAPPPRVGTALRQNTLAEVRAVADRFDHYISDYLKSFKQRDCAVYLWEDSDTSAVCLVGRHGRFGWFLDQVKGQGHDDTELEPEFLASIQQAFASNGIPKSSAIEAIERLYYWGG
jgi:hypothetical protein